MSVEIVCLDQISSHPWAIVDNGILSQARFDTEAAAHLAFRNYSMAGRK